MQIGTSLKDLIGTRIIDYKPLGDESGIYRVFYYDGETGKAGEGYFGDGTGTIYLKRDYDVKLTTSLENYESYESTDNGKILKQLNPLWGDSRYSEIDTKSEHVAAWMFDKKNWKKYLDEENANYVVGAPGIEMYAKSYNCYSSTRTNRDRRHKSRWVQVRVRG